MPDGIPLVTVVTVTYNSGRFIRDAIDSILCSSYENLELLIGDDCSHDDTWDIVQSYNDGRIRAYRNEKNLGEYPNRNKALFMAKGEFLIFIDGDDMIYPHGLEFMVKMLHAFPDSGMALMRWYKNNLFFPVEITPAQLYQGIYFGYGFNDMAFSNVLFRTHLLREDGGLTEVFKNGDDHARLKVGAKSKTLLINDNITFWRETPGQASSKSKNEIRSYLEEYELKQSFLIDSSCPLSEEMKTNAKENLKISICNKIKQLMRTLKFSESLNLFVQSSLSINDISLFFKKSMFIDPFEDFTPEKLRMESFSKNPFAARNVLKQLDK